jgi:glutamyl endopeptidase
MAKTTNAATKPPAAETGKTYGYQSPETTATATAGAASGGGTGASGSGASSVAAKKEKLFDAFEDLIDALVGGITPTGDKPDSGGTAGTGTSGTAGTGTSGTAGTGTSGTAGTGTSGTAGTGTSGTSSTGGSSTGGAGEYPSSGDGTQPGTTPNGGSGEGHVEIPYALLRESYRQDLAKAAARQASTSRQPGRAPSQQELDRKHTSDSNRAPFQRTQEFAPSYGNRGRGSAPTPEVITEPATGERPESAPAQPQPAGVALDAYWGSFGTPAERAQERARIISHQRPETAQLESIIGSDDRVLVTNHEAYPWHCICSLLIRSNTGLTFLGTGWLVSPRVVLTAGHCVYMSDEGGWATQIEVIPGRFAEQRPFGSAISRDLRSVTAWTVDNDRDYDYGAILLPEDKRFGDELGWFGYATRDDAYLRGVTLNLAGYPGDGGKAGPQRQQGTPWYNSRTVSDVNEKQITYEIDTWGGQSGSPVWEMAPDGSRYGLAIHTWGTSVNNGGTRITSEVFDNVVSWAGQVP